MSKLNFLNYWTVAKKLSFKDRKSFFSSFTKSQQKQIQDSYFKGGWQDVFIKNQIDQICDIVKVCYKVDLYDVRIKVVVKNKKMLMSKKIWDEIVGSFSEYDTCFDLDQLFGGIGWKTVKSNPECCELYKIGE